MNSVLQSLPEITNIVGEDNILIRTEERYCYSFDASRLQDVPDCVVFPGNSNEITNLLKLANRAQFPVFPRGAGSGMVGGSVSCNGGVVMVLNRLNRILEIDQDNMLTVVEPGVITGDLQKAVSQYGLFYPPDPGSLKFSTLGGNAATCAGGPRAVKYGVTRDYVMGLEVVLPTGCLAHTGTRTMKGVVGYDLTRLMVGSEGTLGVFTKIILRLVPAPEGIRTLLAVFPQIDDAAVAVREIMSNRIGPSTLELMDQGTIAAVENYLHIGLPLQAEAILLIEIDGYECILDQDAIKVRRICERNGCSSVEAAQTNEDRERLWQARRAISPALGQIRPGKINEDITVPRTKIPTLVRSIRALANKYNLTIISFGHAGDGNLHTNIMLDRKNQNELDRAEKAVEELFRLVLDLGGTLSGEHGIGVTKSPYFQWEIGPESFDLMLRIKQTLDPNNVLNPGKMFVPDRSFYKVG